MRRKKSHHDLRTNPHPDPVTRGISELLNRIPRVGSSISRIYLWRYNMINTMIVGATGTILTFLLYEGIFRNLMFMIWGGAFLGMVITTFLVFFWNYFWNRHWSLSIDAQLYSMKKGELIDVMDKIGQLLINKHEADADDLPYSAQSE